jgi:NTP pyrophosphatase (non-canonical NTP hydrolase)
MISFGDRVATWFEDRKITDNSNSVQQVGKLLEEVGELVAALGSFHNLMLVNTREQELAVEEQVKDAIGDCAVVLAGIASMEGMTFEQCCEHAWEQIKDRKGYLNTKGIFVKETD